MPFASNAPSPVLSVIVHSSHRRPVLRACLEALARQTQPVREFEVILILNSTRDIAAAVPRQPRWPFALRLCEARRLSHAAALNAAVKMTVGQYCLFLENNVIASPACVEEHWRAQDKSAGAVFLGRMEVVAQAGADGFAHWVAERENERHRQLLARRRIATFRDCRLANLSAPRAALVPSTTSAPAQLPERNMQVAYRLWQAGLSVHYLPAAQATQEYSGTFREIVSDAEHAGAAGLGLFQHDPTFFGGADSVIFDELSPRADVLRGVMLALRVPVSLAIRARMLFVARAQTDKWYRFLYGYAQWKGARRAASDRHCWQRLTRGTPILMYHAIGPDGESPSRWVLPRSRFAQHMAWLKRAGYRALSLDQFLRYREHAVPVPARSVVITFDDGYADNYTFAYPILRQHCFPATIFLVSRHVGDRNRWDRDGALAGRPLVSWPAIQEMSREGISFGVHSRTHRPLTALDTNQLQAEVQGARADLEQALGTSLELFAYPHGKFNSAVQRMVRKAGFVAACAADPGLNTAMTPAFALRRSEIRGTDSLVRFVLSVICGDSIVRSARSSTTPPWTRQHDQHP